MTWSFHFCLLFLVGMHLALKLIRACSPRAWHNALRLFIPNTLAESTRYVSVATRKVLSNPTATDDHEHSDPPPPKKPAKKRTVKALSDQHGSDDPSPPKKSTRKRTVKVECEETNEDDQSTLEKPAKRTTKTKTAVTIVEEELPACLLRLQELTKLNSANKHYLNTSVQDLLTDPEFVILAYSRIKSNPGNMSQGSDQETFDGIDYDWFGETAAKIKDGSFHFRPARKVMIPKPKGGHRMLAVASPRDKIVQECMRMILEAIFESSFLDNSHGFRPGRGCHSALLHIQNTFHDVDWFIEGDISKCFDSFHHNLLQKIVGERISDPLFKRLLQEALTVGYVEIAPSGSRKEPEKLKVGTPQGSIMSPLLCNVYMDNVDKYLMAKTVENQRHQKIEFARYADDILIGIKGSSDDAGALREELSNYLADELHLNLSLEKTKVTDARNAKAMFLGTEIQIQKDNSVMLNAPVDQILKKMEKKGYLGDRENAQVGDHVKDIIRHYVAMTRGTLRYYGFAANYVELRRIMFDKLKESLIETLKFKFGVSEDSIRLLYGDELRYRDKDSEGKEVVPKKPQLRPVEFNEDVFPKDIEPIAFVKKDAVANLDLEDKAKNIKKTKALLCSQCSLCGSTEAVKVHHVRVIRSSAPAPSMTLNPVASDLRDKMKKINRKQAPVCRSCFDMVINRLGT